MRALNKHHRWLLGIRKQERAYKEKHGAGIHGYYRNDKKYGPHYKHFSYADQWAKNYSNRIIRRIPVDVDISNGNTYRKIWDYECFCW